MLSLFVLLYVLIIAIFKTIVFFICAISVFFDNMLNKIKSNHGRVIRTKLSQTKSACITKLQPFEKFIFLLFVYEWPSLKCRNSVINRPTT